MYCKKCDKELHRSSCPIKLGKYHCRVCNEEVNISLNSIVCVNALEMPVEVEDYCLDREISTHYQNEVIMIENDNNIFAKWLRINGYKFKSEDCDLVAIIAT